MKHASSLAATFLCGTLIGTALLAGRAADAEKPKPDAAADALEEQAAGGSRPEQEVKEHDRSAKFDPKKAQPLTKALKDQPKGGKLIGFDFARDPLNAPAPFTEFADVMKKES